MRSADLDLEMALVARLEEHGMHVFAGLTTREQRKARVREAIAHVGALVIVGADKDGKPVTYAQEFEATYSEPLTLPTKAPANSTASHADRSVEDPPVSTATGAP